MRGTSHLAIGFLTGAALCSYYQIPPFERVAVTLAASTVGAMLPDIDQPGRWISNRLFILAWPFHWLKHRGLTHSLVALALIFASLTYAKIDPSYSIAFMCGWASHLVADMLTVQGIELLWPIPFRIKLLPGPLALEGGGLVEQLFAIGCWFVSVRLLNGL
jgi:inner membrane protein